MIKRIKKGGSPNVWFQKYRGLFLSETKQTLRRCSTAQNMNKRFNLSYSSGTESDVLVH